MIYRLYQQSMLDALSELSLLKNVPPASSRSRPSSLHRTVSKDRLEGKDCVLLPFHLSCHGSYVRLGSTKLESLGSSDPGL